MRILVRLPVWIAAGIALVLLAGWALYALDANESQPIVVAVLDAARFFADPFRFIFQLEDNVLQVAVNWGIAAVAYLVAGTLLSALLERAATALTAREAPSEGARSPRAAR